MEDDFVAGFERILEVIDGSVNSVLVLEATDSIAHGQDRCNLGPFEVRPTHLYGSDLWNSCLPLST